MRGGVYCRIAWNLDLNSTNQILASRNAAELTRVKTKRNKCRVWVASLFVNNFRKALK